MVCGARGRRAVLAHAAGRAVTDSASRARLRRFFLPSEALASERFLFPPRESHHIATVLRLRPGARVMVFDGRREVEAELLTVADAAVTARPAGTARAALRPMEVALLQGIARGARMDLVVRMATEIGAASLTPVVTARSLPAPGASRADRWRRIAQDAAKQCGRADLLDVRPATELRAALAALDPVDLFVVPWEGVRDPIGAVIGGRAFAAAAVLVGPEGGLTDDEVDAARAVGGVAVSLGPLILRTETAGLVTVAMLLYERLLRPAG
jgi:16S rRNA (uracil1498-N3)-methyltransferase